MTLAQNLPLLPSFVYTSSEDSGKTCVCTGLSEPLLFANAISTKISYTGYFHAQIQRGDKGPYPLENHKAIGFLSNTGPDPLENRKATKPAFNVGPKSARQ